MSKGGNDKAQPRAIGMRKAKFGKRKGDDAVVRLKDLAPPRDVRGGAGRLLFGEQRQPAPEGEPALESRTDPATTRPAP